MQYLNILIVNMKVNLKIVRRMKLEQYFTLMEINI